ncbi:hypothetical protein PQG02_07640 [Nostoc sp. UHCC 0926]|uniref:hypothetical protein n=1 Tax=unclassified Nostoc TaxID=2593658 RepID=UPI00235FCC2E|nr:hypothetical protein [Nostoc sp. UHCC 0926]WDD34201.1 hypothetical protein PQG02_07640 [Nostoc sp. UHCC 0926]
MKRIATFGLPCGFWVRKASGRVGLRFISKFACIGMLQSPQTYDTLLRGCLRSIKYLLIPHSPRQSLQLGKPQTLSTRPEANADSLAGREEAALWAAGIVSPQTPVRSSRQTLSAVPPGGNPHRPWRLPLGEDRTASPHGWLLFEAQDRIGSL